MFEFADNALASTFVFLVVSEICLFEETSAKTRRISAEGINENIKKFVRSAGGRSARDLSKIRENGVRSKSRTVYLRSRRTRGHSEWGPFSKGEGHHYGEITDGRVNSDES